MLQNRLRPNEDTNNSIVYHLACELEKQGINPHIVLTLPTQFFMIASTSEDSDISAFARDFHSIVSNDLNQTQGSEFALWCPKSFHYKALLTYWAMVKRAAKVLTQAVRKGYVTRMDLWRGIQLRTDIPGCDRVTATKPDFCGDRNSKPASIELIVTDSPLLDQFDKTPEEFRSDLANLVESELAELETHQELMELETMTCEEQFEIDPFDFVLPVPQITTSNDIALVELLENHPTYVAHNQRVRAFRRAYRHAFRAWQEATDKNSINFPIGTYKMRVIHNVQCTAPFALE